MIYLNLMRHAKTDLNYYDGNDFERPISKKGILETGKLNNKSSFFVGSNPYANLISEEQADKNLIKGPKIKS